MVGTRSVGAPGQCRPLALFEEWGLDDIRRHNHDLALLGAHRLAERWDTEWNVPEPLVGSMAMVTLPLTAGTSRDEALTLRDSLLFDEGIEVHMHAGRVRARISAQIYELTGRTSIGWQRLSSGGCRDARPCTMVVSTRAAPGGAAWCLLDAIRGGVESSAPCRATSRTHCAAAHAVSSRIFANWRP
jgi:hypothetical protein